MLSMKKIHCACLVVLLALAGPALRAATTNLAMSVTWNEVPGSPIYHVFVFQSIIVNNETNGQTGPLMYPIEAVTNSGTNVPFEIIVQTTSILILRFDIAPPADSLGETYTFYGNGVSMDYFFYLTPAFIVQPQGQSVFVGTDATFTAEVIHTTGLQWQKDGTNLVENGHYVGVTNSTLTVLSVSGDDAGAYSLVANSTNGPYSSWDAALYVFKPIRLAACSASPPSAARLLAFNCDGSPFEPERVANVDFYSTTNPSLPFSAWSYSTNLAVLINGMLQLELPDTGGENRFWRAVERP
jgi:hypothetical protein